MNAPTGWKRYVWPLTSRKVQVGVAAAITVYLNDLFSWNLSTETVTTIIVAATAVILGIAHEDAGSKVQLPPPGN